MAYAAGDVILRDHYNTFATGGADGTANHAVANINSVWGVGNGDKGYGQSTTLSAVVAGDTVTATQWSTLLSRLNSILTHQSGSGSGITSPVSGDIITYLSTLSGKVTDAYNNRLTYATNSTTLSTTMDGIWNSATPTTFQQVRTVTFTSADTARYFFNAGGRIALTFYTVNGANNTKETTWSTLLDSTLSTFSFRATDNIRTGSGGTLITNGSSIGFWDLTASDQTLIKLAPSSGSYTTNFVEILAKISGAAGSNGGLGTTITFTINYSDVAADDFDDDINMTIRTVMSVLPPEATNLSNVWGAVTTTAVTN